MNRVNLPPSPFAKTPEPETLRDVATRRALATVGIEEIPRGSNKGPEVTRWLERVGIKQPSAWCMAWLWCMFDDASTWIQCVNPVPKTAGALKLWERAPVGCGAAAVHVRENPARIVNWRGLAFVEDHGHGLGHVGIVLGPPDANGVIRTVEGNTVPKGQRSRNGYAVAVQEMRLDDPRLVGFLDFAR